MVFESYTYTPPSNEVEAATQQEDGWMTILELLESKGPWPRRDQSAPGLDEDRGMFDGGRTDISV